MRRIGVLLLALLMVAGAAQAETVLPDPITRTIGGITVQIDPRMELLGIAQSLSDYRKYAARFAPLTSPYQQAAREAFAAYADHPAVAFLNGAIPQGFTYDAPPTAMLYIQPDFMLSAAYDSSAFQQTRMPVDMEAFREAMAQFCADTDFPAFFESQQAAYEGMLDVYVDGFPDWDMLAALEAYTGIRLASYTITLAPMFHSGGYGPSVQDADGTHIHAIIGPERVKDGLPWFGAKGSTQSLILHEFSHSFVDINDPLHPKMVQETARSEALYAPIAAEMQQQAYGTWPVAYEELVLRAMEIDLVARERGIDPAVQLLTQERYGFAYIQTVYDTLALYHENRDLYPTLNDFVSVITDALLAAHEK